MKNKTYIILFLILSFSKLYSQLPNRGCGSSIPSSQYDSLFQQKVIDYLNTTTAASRVQSTFQIPVIFHVIHSGQAVGAYPNLNQAQLNSQIQVLNDDYAGIGFNSSTYPTSAFQAYATNTAVVAASKDGLGRIGISNTGISFCLALKDSLGNILSEPGIERINWSSIPGATNPASATTTASLTTLIDNIIKPNTIWSPNKYLNIWVTDANPSAGLLGFATFPPLSGLAGVSGGGTSTNDGLWCWAKACGSQNIFAAGVYSAPYNYGRTLTHEISHYLGIRHVWGDASCANDFCNDTPPAQTGTYGAQTYPYLPNDCPTNLPPTGPEGVMFMNFADYTDDAFMYMFTEDQKTRMQTAMTNSPYRNQLGTHGFCTPTATIQANFSLSATVINQGQSVNITDLSTASNAITSWNYACTASVPSTSILQNPTLTFNTTGVHTISLTVTAAGLNSMTTKTIQVNACPIPTVNVNSINPTCAGACNGSATLNSVIGSGAPYTYSWTPSVSSSSVASGLCAGVYSCVVTNSCGASVTKIITINPPPAMVVIVGATSASVCAGNSTTLSANVSGGAVPYTFNWSTGSTTSNISVNPTITPVTGYTVTVSDIQGCVKTASIAVTVHPIPSITVTPTNQTICAGKTATINLSGAANFTTNPGGFTSNSFTVNPTSTTVYSINGTSPFGCASSKFDTVKVINPPVVSINTPSTSVCFGYTMTVVANGASNYNWSTGATTNTTIVQPFSNTTFSVIGTNGSSCSDTAFLSLTVMPLPSVLATVSSTMACVGQTIALSASGNAIQFGWNPGTLFGPNHVVQVFAPTTFTALGQGSNGCAFFSTAFVDVQNGNAVIPVATPSAVCVGDSAILSVIGGTIPMWSTNVIPNTSFVTPIAPTNYTLSAIDFNGCVSDIVFMVDINSNCNVIVYNGFTPNGDGVNDFFIIDNIDKYPNNNVHIFNRWGNKVFTTSQYNNINNKWDGKVNGTNVTSGTYFYLITNDNGKVLKKGWVEITN